MEEKCFSPGCFKPVEYTCSCVDPRILLCEAHLSWHISNRKNKEHVTKRLETAPEPDNKDCTMCLRKPSKLICLCRGMGVKLCNECFDLHSIQNQGRHAREPYEATEFIKDERDVYSYLERRDQIESVLKVIRDNAKEIQSKEEMLRMLNTKILDRVKKWFDEKLVKVSQVKKALKQFEEDIRKCKFKKDISSHWFNNFLKERDINKTFQTARIEINEEALEAMVKNIVIIEMDTLLVQHTDLNRNETYVPTIEKDSGAIYQRIQATYSDHGSRMIPKLNTLFAKALEPSKIDTIQQVELSNCVLGINGCRHLAIVLPVLSQLTYLNLSSNNMGPNGIKEIAPSLGQVPSLLTLMLAWNKLDNKGAEYLSEALPELGKLKALQLSWNDITELGAQFLARGLVHCNKLEKLELWNNPIGPEGARNLVLCLPYLTKLKILDLNKTELGPEGLDVLSLALPKLPELTTLCIANNNVSAAGIASLAKSIGANKNLQVIDLARNSIKSDATQSLQDTMTKLQKETTLILNGNTFSKEDRNKLRSCASCYGLRLN